MARFKFGKKKRDGSEGSVKSSIDFPRRSYSTGGGQIDSPQHYVSSPVQQHQPEYQQQGSPQIPTFSKTDVDAEQQQQQQLQQEIANPGSTYVTPNPQFDSTLDPKLTKGLGASAESNSSKLSPWKRHKLFNSPFPRYRHAALTFSSDKNEIFLMGGLKEGSVFGDTWKITPELDENKNLSFTTKNVEIANNTNPPARVGHSSVLCGNAFIIYGGDTVDTDFNGFPDNNFYLFNINNNKYTVPLHILNKPHGRYGHTIGVIALNNSSSRLYLFGGQLENDVFNDLYYFELNTFKLPKARWETIEPLNNFKPPPLTNHSMCVHKNRIYVFGGVYNNEKVSNDLWCFDAIINKWTQVTTTGAIPLPVNEQSACLVNDKMYIYGGNDFSGTIYDTFYVLDLHTLVWLKLIDNDDISFSSPGPRCGHSMTYLQSFKKLIIMGGDKNDYIDSNPNNFDTYEDFNGQEIGTMIYELDLLTLDSFLSDKPTKGKINVLKKPSPKKDIAPPPNTTSDINGSSTLIEQQQYQTVTNGHEREGHHMRSFSTGPEDFRTPNASPSRSKGTHAAIETTAALAAAGAGLGASAVGAETYLNHTNEDKFVDFDNETQDSKPSTILPAPSFGDEKHEKKVSNNQTFHNGHASFLENYQYVDSEEKIRGVESDSRAHEIEEIDQSESDLNTAPVRQISITNTGRRRAGSRSGNNGSTSGAESSEVKKLVGELTAELTNLKNSTTEQINEASLKIDSLERENEQLRSSNEKYLNFDDEIKKYEAQVQERDSVIASLRNEIGGGDEQEGGEVTSKSISELNQHKLDKLELKNKLVYLEKENTALNDKLIKFEPFMNNQITDLSNFQKLIKVQEEKIANLSNQVRDQQDLQKDVLEWKHKFESLEIEYNNYRTINAEDEIEVSDDEADADILEPPHGGADSSTARSIMSSATGRRSKKDISSHLENLVNLWSRGPSGSSSLDPNASRALDPNASGSTEKEIDPIVNKLQNQVNELLTISKEQQAGSASEINDLRLELTAKLQALKTFENNYRDALQSVNNTSRALDSTNVELDKQKELTKKLVKENEELKLYQKASKRVSSRNATPISTIQEDQETDDLDKSEDHNEDFSSAHYNMKIQDLQADLFIMKQERDQLKDDVNALKKQLYLASQRERS